MKIKDSYEINKHRLDLELLEQPKLFHMSADKLADAEAEVDRLKGKLELVGARLELMIRKEPSAYGLKKITESIVEKTVVTEEEYQDTLSEFIDAKALARHLKADVDYLSQRRGVLENLVKLRLSDYWADPRISGDAYEQGNRALRQEAVDLPKRGK